MNPSKTMMLPTSGNGEALQRSLNLLNKVGKALEKLNDKIECRSTRERTGKKNPAVQEKLAKGSRDISICKTRLTRIRSKLEKVICNKLSLKKDVVRIMMMKSDLDTEVYECPICLDPIAKAEEIWTCKTCHNILHLLCTRKHASATIENGETSWKCPICRHVVPTPPGSLSYFCFCGATKFPAAIDCSECIEVWRVGSKRRNTDKVPGRTAHGCGQRCRKMPKCTLVCHPAVCPE